MKKQALLIAAILFTGVTFAQRSEVVKVFSKYQIDTAVLSVNSKQNSEAYFFDLTARVVTDGKEKVMVSKYDPTLSEDKRWILLTVNGKTPSKSDLKLFNKQHYSNIPPTRANENTYKVVKEDSNEIVISYRVDTASLIADNKFLGDCDASLYINTKTGRMEKSEIMSTGSFKIKMFNAEGMNSNTTFFYDETDKVYLPLKEEVSLTIKLLGKPLETITINEYTHYKRK
jgi:hypothetical protein